VQRHSALRAGLAFLPLAAGVIVIAPSASWLVGRFGPAPTLIAGPLVFAGGLVYLSYLPVHAPTSPSCLAWSWPRPWYALLESVTPGSWVFAAESGQQRLLLRLVHSWRRNGALSFSAAGSSSSS
jgi:hypothetical protein